MCLGLPYATSLWQVGNALEQNGTAKTEWYRAKQELIDFKRAHNLPCSISADDIIPLVNKIFHKAYNNQAANKKAIAERGWLPPNRVFLKNASLQQDKKKAGGSTDGSTGGSTSFNTKEGVLATTLDKLLDHRSRSEGRKKRLKRGRRQAKKL